MLKPRRPSALTHSVPFALAAAAALLCGSATAEEGRPASPLAGLVEPVATASDAATFEDSCYDGVPCLGPADLDAYDMPGEIVVDARDNLDSSELASLARDFS